MNLLVTGGAGFIGSHFIHYELAHDSAVQIVNLDLLTYAADLDNLDAIKDERRYVFVQGNITNRELVTELVRQYRIDAIVNFAAESHVDRSIRQPDVFIASNVQGVAALLAVSRACHIGRFLQVSTDEVYGSLGPTGYSTEEAALRPNSPYAASKAAADLLVRAAVATYGLDACATRCANNYGPYQFPEKLIPLMVTNGLLGEKLPLYGDGLNMRDWLAVQDHCRAIDLVLRRGQTGNVYNVSGRSEHTNREIAERIVAALHLPDDAIVTVPDRLGDDRRYAVDPTKIMTELGWRPEVSFDDGLQATIQWYVDHETWWRPLKKRAALD
ncbi:hypothetical protein IV38_GL001360 [Lactobacillus selangorensis]|uniref:dTDP-glucose 4,6-dehydratase n=1 Tax=Lactobacillus selangorensis TaxID=81857 RepID=A0A0R2FI73_9LACO|nr:dTDP-glucose 4,6-dehydratase [Lactobacillus selangorensis]KRN28361.1 hypothetical protein IV38_GL001360 [Lactobacillus selangorensis]KRN31862.1 hypothetical protein IV40_GL001147 [Lactobacillus selangorensis]